MARANRNRICRAAGAAACLSIAAATASASTDQRAAARAQVTRPITNAVCKSDVGVGVKTRRRFCDVIVASTAVDSIALTLPPHSGPAVLMFDLHNRFTVPPAGVDPAQAFTRNTAVVAVIRPTGEVIERAAVSREFRTIADLFDRIAGPGRGGAPRIVAPGQAQAARVEIPAAVGSLGIVGQRLEEWRASGRGTFDNPDKPIAMVSNLRVEYTPR